MLMNSSASGAAVSSPEQTRELWKTIGAPGGGHFTSSTECPEQAPMLARRMSFLTKFDTAARKQATIAGTVGGQIIDLTRDEVLIEHPSFLREEAIPGINAGMNSCDSIGLTPLRKAIAAKLSAEMGDCWKTEDIVITAGAPQALFHVALAVLNPNDEAIVIRPCWTTLPLQILLTGATPVFVDALRPRYIPDVSAIRAAVTPSTKAILINSPNNPTGAVYYRSTLENIGELALNSQLWIISDERYSSSVFTGARRHVSIVTAHPGVRSQTIVINEFSNEPRINDWTLGYLAAPAEIVFALRTLQRHTKSIPNVVAQHAILHHLQFGEKTFNRQLHERLAGARNMGLHILSDLRDVSPPRADGSLFFYLDLSRLLSSLPTGSAIQSAADVARLLLEEANVACVPGDAFGDINGLRLSFGTPPDLLEIGLKRIVETLNTLRDRQEWPDFHRGRRC